MASREKAVGKEATRSISLLLINALNPTRAKAARKTYAALILDQHWISRYVLDNDLEPSFVPCNTSVVVASDNIIVTGVNDF